MTFQLLKKQPGMISLDGNNNSSSEELHETNLVNKHFVKVIDSCIGHFEIKDQGSVLYWMQKFTFNHLELNLSITEYGVCTDNGLVMRHHVRNRSAESVRIQVEDQDIDRQFNPQFGSDQGLTLTDGGFVIETNDQG
ncbi:hypothetical protein KQX54_012454 [Cotesia glomerata]|uniref:Uncharacterized protein n=1 Tax=Cotesia glomerata TaxID=32391 RepID=A0AAV7IRF6_COTGL|nr:hypothetical protein KQX54_012454 [Cotesia glomerata]